MPRVGPKSAEVITRWLIEQRGPGKDTNKALIAPYIVAPSEVSRRPAIVPLVLGPCMTHPVPLEHMLPLRSDPASSQTKRTDLELVLQWLDAKPRAPHTRSSYRKEAERLLLWLAQERQRLTDMTAESLQRYAGFYAHQSQPGSGADPRVRGIGCTGGRLRGHSVPVRKQRHCAWFAPCSRPCSRRGWSRPSRNPRVRPMRTQGKPGSRDRPTQCAGTQ